MTQYSRKVEVGRIVHPDPRWVAVLDKLCPGPPPERTDRDLRMARLTGEIMADIIFEELARDGEYRRGIREDYAHLMEDV